MFKFTENGKEYKKSNFRKTFEGSEGLFESCWGEFLSWFADTCNSVYEIEECLDYLASQRVNDPKSKWYITG